MFVLSVPEAQCKPSQSSSASSRRRFIRQSRRLSGSRREDSSLTNRLAIWYVRESISKRCICFRLQPWAMNCCASQSSRSGWLGGWPILPKSFAVLTRPRPKCHCQRRLTITRAVKG